MSSMAKLSSQRHLLVRGLGYGVFVAEVVPPELGPEGKRELRNGDRKKTTEELTKRIRRSGLPKLQEVIPDPEDPEKAVLILGEGKEPCRMEMDQLQEYETRLGAIAEANPGSRLSDRLRMLRKAAEEAGRWPADGPCLE